MKKLGIVLALMSMVACGEGYSEGERAGVVTKFSHKGIFCKTWEGELNMGGMTKHTDSKRFTSFVANIWSFSVTNPALVSQIQEAMDEGKPVTLQYSQWVIAPICKSESSYIVTGVK